MPCEKPCFYIRFVFIVVIITLIPVNQTCHANDIDKQLFRAAKYGNVTEIRNLLKQGANLEFKNRKGYTALHIATIKGYLDVVELLIEAGANIDNVSNIGSTPLMSAAYRSYTAILQALLAAGADTKPRSDNGNTAFDIAEKFGDPACEELIEYGHQTHSLSINTPASMELSTKKFKDSVKFALYHRGWRVDKESDVRIEASLDKRGRIFKVVIQREQDHIQVSFVPYYGSRKPNYLLNLKRDVEGRF